MAELRLIDHLEAAPPNPQRLRPDRIERIVAEIGGSERRHGES
jgi:hypothetical protein